jgi:hypothetical protein
MTAPLHPVGTLFTEFRTPNFSSFERGAQYFTAITWLVKAHREFENEMREELEYVSEAVLTFDHPQVQAYLRQRYTPSAEDVEVWRAQGIEVLNGE